MSKNLETADWIDAEKLLYGDKVPAPEEPERQDPLTLLEDRHPKIANIFRWAGASVFVIVEFPVTFSGPRAVCVVNPPIGAAFALAIYGERLAIDAESFVRVGDDGLTVASMNFWRLLAARLGASLAAAPVSGASQ